MSRRARLESFGLKSVARHFGVSEPGRVILEGSGILQAYREDAEAFRTYALQDVRETRALAGILSRSYFIQAQIFPYNYQDVIIRGNATKIDALFLREYLPARSFPAGDTGTAAVRGRLHGDLRDGRDRGRVALRRRFALPVGDAGL